MVWLLVAMVAGLVVAAKRGKPSEDGRPERPKRVSAQWKDWTEADAERLRKSLP